METLQATTLTNGQTALSEDAVRAFAGRLRGELLRPGDDGYDAARLVWNGMIDRRPALIARCTDPDDVVAAVTFAREHDLLLAVRGGGHNVAGYATCDGGLVIDLSRMNAVEVDPERKTVRAEGGATWADVDHATQAHGLATPGGVVSDTGIAGLTLGGGLGWLRGKHGLSIDNLLSAEVVTADGRRITASEDEHADLFWALRGGGGNFGVVTSFEYRLHEVGPEVFFCFVFHDGRGDGMRDGLRFFRDHCETVPDEIAPIAVCGVIPPGAEAFPEAIHGVPFVLFAAMYVGSVEEGERALEPFRTFAEPLIDLSGPMSYTEVQTVFDEDYPAHELRYYWKSLNLERLPDEAIDHIAAHAKRQPSPYSTTDIWHLGGAVQRVGETDTAFGGRRAAYVFNPEANWEDSAEDDANIGWARETLDAVRDFSDGSRYLNFPGFHEEGEATMQATFGSKYERLAEIKAKYDSSNLFRLNQNIEPMG